MPPYQDRLDQIDNHTVEEWSLAADSYGNDYSAALEEEYERLFPRRDDDDAPRDPSSSLPLQNTGSRNNHSYSHDTTTSDSVSEKPKTPRRQAQGKIKTNVQSRYHIEEKGHLKTRSSPSRPETSPTNKSTRKNAKNNVELPSSSRETKKSRTTSERNNIKRKFLNKFFKSNRSKSVNAADATASSTSERQLSRSGGSVAESTAPPPVISNSKSLLLDEALSSFPDNVHAEPIGQTRITTKAFSTDKDEESCCMHHPHWFEYEQRQENGAVSAHRGLPSAVPTLTLGCTSFTCPACQSAYNAPVPNANVGPRFEAAIPASQSLPRLNRGWWEKKKATNREKKSDGQSVSSSASWAVNVESWIDTNLTMLEELVMGGDDEDDYPESEGDSIGVW